MYAIVDNKDLFVPGYEQNVRGKVKVKVPYSSTGAYGGVLTSLS